jgi:hypothetical protein
MRISSCSFIEFARLASDLAVAFAVLDIPLTENGILTLLASGSAHDKVEHAPDRAIKFVAGQARAIAFN